MLSHITPKLPSVCVHDPSLESVDGSKFTASSWDMCIPPRLPNINTHSPFHSISCSFKFNENICGIYKSSGMKHLNDLKDGPAGVRSSFFMIWMIEDFHTQTKNWSVQGFLTSSPLPSVGWWRDNIYTPAALLLASSLARGLYYSCRWVNGCCL